MAGTASDTGSNSTRILVAMCLQTCLVLGTVKSLGVFLKDIDISLDMSDTDNGIMFGIYMAMTFCPAPFIAYVIHKRIFRRLQVIGAICGSVGLLCTAFAPNKVILIALLAISGPLMTYLFHKRIFRRLQLILGAILGSTGLLCAAFAGNKVILIACLAFSGFGNCLMSVCFVISLSETAGERFNILYGFGKSGYAFGMSLIPLVANFLMELYGWRGAMMIVGAIMANIIPLALSHETDESPAVSNLEDTNGLVEEEGLVQPVEESTSGMVGESGRPGTSSGPTDGTADGRMRSEPKMEEHVKWDKSDDLGIATESHSLLDDRQLDFDKESSRKLVETPKTTGSCPINWNAYCAPVKESIFYTDPFLMSIFLGNFVFGMVDSSWHSFLIPRAVDRGISTTLSIGLVASAAVASFIGRFNTRCLTYHDVTALMTLLNICSLILESFTQNYVIMLATSFASSLTIASRSALFVIVVKERGSTSTFPMLFALTEVLFGLGAFFGPYIEGITGDLLGSLDKVFFLLAGLDLVVFFTLIPWRCIWSKNE